MIFRFLFMLFVFVWGLCVSGVLKNLAREIDISRNISEECLGLPAVLKLFYLPAMRAEKFLSAFTWKMDELERIMDFSGLGRFYTARMYVAFSIVLMILAILFCIVIAGFAVFSSIIVGTIVALSIAIIIPGERIKKRTADTEKYLPDLLDMASLLARSGVDIIESIIRSRVVAGSGALRDDIAGLSRLMAAGLGRQEALQDISRRTPSANFRSVLSFVIGADRMGSGTADILEDVAKRLRQKRIMLALKKGGRNSQLALVPLVFFIMPSTILVVFGPLVVRYLQGGVDALLR